MIEEYTSTVRAEPVERTLRVHQIELTPELKAMLTCSVPVSIPGAGGCTGCENPGLCEWAVFNRGCWQPKPKPCDKAPKGWRCSLTMDHEGPCPTWPNTLWLKLVWAWRMKSLSILFGRHL